MGQCPRTLALRVSQSCEYGEREPTEQVMMVIVIQRRKRELARESERKKESEMKRERERPPRLRFGMVFRLRQQAQPVCSYLVVHTRVSDFRVFNEQ